MNILENSGTVNFESTLTVGNDYSLTLTNTFDGTTFPSANAPSWHVEAGGGLTVTKSVSNFSLVQNGSNGGRFQQSFGEIATEISIQFSHPSFSSTNFYLELSGSAPLRIFINTNRIEIVQFDVNGFQTIVGTVTAGLVISQTISVSYSVGQVSILTPANLHTFSIIPITATGFSVLSIGATPLQFLFYGINILTFTTGKNLTFSIPIELATEYIAGDVMLVSVHEGSDYGGSSIVPRTSGQFTPVTTTRDVSLNENGFQRFWARILTNTEPDIYRFTRGDSESYYDSPSCVGFIVRGVTLNNLSITFSASVEGTNSLQVISSNSCGALEGDLVYGYAHNESNYDKMYYVLNNSTPIVEVEAFERCEDIFSTFPITSPPINYTQGSIVNNGTENVWRLSNTGTLRHTRSGFTASAPVVIEVELTPDVSSSFGFEFGGQFSGTVLQIYSSGNTMNHFLTGSGGASFGTFTLGNKIRIRVESMFGTTTATCYNLTINSVIGVPLITNAVFDGNFQFFNSGGTTDVYRFAAGYGNIIPVQDAESLFWSKTFPYGVTSLREAVLNDDGIVYFQNSVAQSDYRIFSARISGDTVQTTLPNNVVWIQARVNIDNGLYPKYIINKKLKTVQEIISGTVPTLVENEILYTPIETVPSPSNFILFGDGFTVKGTKT